MLIKPQQHYIKKKKKYISKDENSMYYSTPVLNIWSSQVCELWCNKRSDWLHFACCKGWNKACPDSFAGAGYPYRQKQKYHHSMYLDVKLHHCFFLGRKDGQCILALSDLEDKEWGLINAQIQHSMIQPYFPDNLGNWYRSLKLACTGQAQQKLFSCII